MMHSQDAECVVHSEDTQTWSAPTRKSPWLNPLELFTANFSSKRQTAAIVQTAFSTEGGAPDHITSGIPITGPSYTHHPINIDADKLTMVGVK